MLAREIYNNELIGQGYRGMNSEFRLYRLISGRGRIREKRVDQMTLMVASDGVLNAFADEEIWEE